jgi:glucose/arabinose dehydrogenase
MGHRTTRLALALALAAGLATVLVPTACSSGAPAPSATTGPASSTTVTRPPSTRGSTATSTTGSTTTASPSPTSRAGSARGSVTVIRTVATGLDVPWGLARLPGGGVLVTTRDDATVHRLDVGTGRTTTVGTVPGVVSNVGQGGEGGLLGIAPSPTFATDRTLFVYFSTAGDNRVATVTYDPSQPAGRQLSAPHVLLKGIPHGVHHNGGRIAFGPDGYLYVTTGEAGDRPLAQDRGSLGGKILRMTTDGKPAPGNPFGSLVWTYGHRNVEGIAWDAAGNVWASEFGDHLHDELNLIRKGRNYGWPQTEGKTSASGITSPVEQWSPVENSPSGIAVAAGSVWMAALRGRRLWRIPLDGTRPAAAPQAFLQGRYGRLRSVLALDDETLLVTTSNRDGRATPGAGDDRILLLRVR